MIKQISELIEAVRVKNPLVHNITNYVTVNDCANIQLACGGSPIMADSINEAPAITAISTALVINMGTLNERTVESMLASGITANRLGIPVIFDPVGAGASDFRNKTAKTILAKIDIAILRGNLSEISFIAGLSVKTKGVDSTLLASDNDRIEVAKAVSNKLHCVTAITGVTDIITDGRKVLKLANGNTMMTKVTGTGCMTSALIGAYAGATPDYLLAAVTGVSVMAISGDIAFDLSGSKGTGSFKTAIIDSVSTIDGNIIKERIKIDEC